MNTTSVDIENLARLALIKIKSKFDLPEKGTLAGGSLANTIWELVSGNKAIINDIDIFILGDILDIDKNESIDNQRQELLKSKSLFSYKEAEDVYTDEGEYIGFKKSSLLTERYNIVKASNKGIINEIIYESSSTDSEIVIKSFDINATKVCYSIDNDKFYWTKDFEEFLKSGELKISNLSTPAHTAIRLSKKSKDLNASVSDFEYKICQHALKNSLSGIIRRRFKKKYMQDYYKNENVLSEYFKVTEDEQLAKYIKDKYNSDDKVYELTSIDTNIFSDIFLNIPSEIHYVDDFLFYMRNIYGDEEKREIFKKVGNYYKDPDYLDVKVSEKDLNLLFNISKYAPLCLNNLNGYKISEQIKLIKNLLNRYKNEPIIAISILENFKIDKDIKIDDETSLILELSVRKHILNDYKANKILEI